MTLFLCHFLPLSDLTEGIVCVPAYVSNCFVWSFTFTDKSDCDKVNDVSSVIRPHQFKF